MTTFPLLIVNFLFPTSFRAWRTRLCLFLVLSNFFAVCARSEVGGPAGIVLFHRKGTETFLLLADHQPPSKRGWGGFGGKHEQGETPAMTAARETEEETRGFYKRADLLEKIKDQTPFKDGAFYLFFLEVEHVNADQIAASEIPENDKSYRERGPWAWFPFSEIQKHLGAEPDAKTAAFVSAQLLPAGSGSKHYWPIWLQNMYRAMKAGVLPWMKSNSHKAAAPITDFGDALVTD